jgi:propanol-preferring alcohol dehydrogenase
MAAKEAASGTTEYVIPKECKAGVVYNEGPNFELKVEMVPVPEPGPDDILIKLNATGICYSDIHFLLNDLAPVPMSLFGVRSPGHEGAGVVVKLGANVKNFKVGDRAGIKPLTDVCRACELCWSGKENYCPNAIHTGLMVTGTYQQYVSTPARYASPIHATHEEVSDFVAAPIMCSASTMVRSLTDSGLIPGNWAAFPGGAGGVGIQGVQIAKAMGFRPIVIDTSEAKKKLALEIGAEAFVDFNEVKDVAEEVTKIAGGIGAHGVFITAPAAYKTAISLVGKRVGAKIMCIGLPSKDKAEVLGTVPGQYVMQNLTIKGTLVGTMEDTHKALDLAKRGYLKQICEIYPIDKLPQAVDDVIKGKVPGRAVIDFNA